jgi:hypothetical protein
VFVSSWSPLARSHFRTLSELRHSWDTTAMPVYSQAVENKEFSVRSHSLDVCSAVRLFLEGRGREMEMSCLCNAKKSPRQIFELTLQGSLAPSFTHLRAGQTFLLHSYQYINQYSNTPALHYFITPSRGNLLVLQSSPFSSFAQNRYTVKHASTSHKVPSSKHRHCWLIDSALRSISIFL